MVAKYLISAAECLRSMGYYQSRSYHSYHHHNHPLEAPLLTSSTCDVGELEILQDSVFLGDENLWLVAN